ncbi:MAG: AIR synthase family protein [Dehalococcoidia bacterium]
MEEYRWGGMTGANQSTPQRLKAGKLPAGHLRRMLADIQRDDPRVLLGPGVGEDAALISFGATTLIAKSDPVTFASDLAGWYAVQVNANDVAACGGEPKWFLATVLLPEGAPAETAEHIFTQLRDAAAGLGVTLVGGHTEITVGMPRPIICGTMLGEVNASGAIHTSGASPGDVIILTKGIAIEGTAILAREAGERLSSSGLDAAIIERAAGFLFDPGISVVPDSRAARAAHGVTAMHDPTEGGLATALAELAEASGIGIEIDPGAVHVFAETTAICGALGVDPWGLIASGALLLAASPAEADGVLRSLRSAGIDAAVIGAATAPGNGLVILDGDSRRPIPVFERDEVARILESEWRD